MTTYSAPQVCQLAGVSYRQLDYWCRTQQLDAAVPARGSGSQRRFDVRAAQIAWALGQLSKLGAPRLPDVSELRTLARFDGWLVWTQRGVAVVSDPAELATYTTAAIVSLARCPIIAEPLAVTA